MKRRILNGAITLNIPPAPLFPWTIPQPALTIAAAVQKQALLLFFSISDYQLFPEPDLAREVHVQECDTHC